MMYSLDKNSDKAVYLQLYELLRCDIVNGVYPQGSRLPSKRLLAEELGISRITAEHAYNLLCDEGYVQSRERSGYYVLYSDSDDVYPAEHDAKREKYSQTRESEESLRTESTFPFSVYAKTVRRVLAQYGERIMQKSPSSGCPELKNAIANYLARERGISVSTDQIVIGSGAEYLYGLVVGILGRDKIYGIEDPSYEKIEMVYGTNGARCEFLALGNDGIDSSALRSSKADVLHITPYRSFPSGVTASASKRREYITWAEKRGGILIEDDFESEFSALKKPEETVFSLAPDGCVLYINSFSKTLAPSVRVGYLVLPKKLVGLYQEKAGFYSCTVPTLEQYVLAQLIDSGDFERHIHKIRREKRKHL